MAKRLVKAHGLRIEEGRTTQQNAFQKLQDTQDRPDTFLDRLDESLPLCVHGHVMHTPQEVGGACSHCHRLLCTECTQVQCAIDGNVLYRDHAASFRQKAICRSHCLLRMVVFDLFEA